MKCIKSELLYWVTIDIFPTLSLSFTNVYINFFLARNHNR